MNEGHGPWPKGESWVYVEDPVKHVMATAGLKKQPVEGTKQTREAVDKADHELSKQRKQHVAGAAPPGPAAWSD